MGKVCSVQNYTDILKAPSGTETLTICSAHCNDNDLWIDVWLFTPDIKKSLNGVSSKMLSSITKNTIHEEAKNPSFNVVENVKSRRKSYLGHLL